jgi:hypothetical protein
MTFGSVWNDPTEDIVEVLAVERWVSSSDGDERGGAGVRSTSKTHFSRTGRGNKLL